MSSSVSAARSVTPGDTWPSSESRSADVTDASRLDPATTPLVIEPRVLMAGGGRAGPGRGRAPRLVSGAYNARSESTDGTRARTGPTTGAGR